MEATSQFAHANAKPAIVAPWWHTILLVIAIPAYGLYQLNRTPAIMTGHFQNHRMLAYAAQTLFEAAVWAYVWIGLRLTNTRASELVGGRWSSIRGVLRDIGIAFLLWIAVIAMLITAHMILRDKSAGLRVILPLLPRGYQEMIGWVVMSVAAGFCEEFIFRGYLLRQFLALSGRRDVAVLLQAVLFGTAHLYQGVRGAITVGVYGILFGIVAVWAKTLRPGMIQHAAQDSFTGIIGGLLVKYRYL